MTSGSSSRPIATLLLCAAELALCGGASVAALPELTRAEYAGALARVSTVLFIDKSHNTQIALGAIAPVSRCVVRVGATLIFVDNRPLASFVAAAESGAPDRDVRLAAAKARVDEIRVDLEERVDTGEPAKGVAKARILLSSSEYASDPIPPPSGADLLGRKIQKWWDDFWKKFSYKGPSLPSPHISPKVPLAILIVIVTAAAGILIWYLYGLLSRMQIGQSRNRPESMLAMNEEEAQLVATRNFDRLMDLASSHASDTDYRSAFRLVYVALLVALDTDGIVRLNRSKTNWEYVRALNSGRYQPLHSHMTPITRDFDRIWYGFRQANAGDYERAVAQYGEIRRVAAELAASNAVTTPG